MRRLRLLLLALLFVLSTIASAAASVHTCCATPDCDIAHCIDMGCAPSLPVFAADMPKAAAVADAVQSYFVRPILRPRNPLEEVWIPPD
jgi:hypothetical protein